MWDAGRPSPESITAAAKAAGTPAAALDDPSAEAELKRNIQLAEQLGATGTPLFVIGDRVFNTALDYNALKQAIDAARAKG
jgi:protein-disulfide isomerase